MIKDFQKISGKSTKIILALLLLASVAIADAAPKKKSTYAPKINRADVGINIGDSIPGSPYGGWSWSSLNHGFGLGGVQHTTSKHVYVGHAIDIFGGRSFGLDITSRTSMDTFGHKSELAKLFYIAIDGYFAGASYNNTGFVGWGVGANAGFMFPILAIKGSNPYLGVKDPMPINLNFFAELGLGYYMGTLYSTINSGASAHLHTVNPGIALGINMSFKTVPDLELEIAYKLLPGWRNNLYTRLQYDFMSFGKGKKFGAYFQFDALYLAANLGLAFRY